MPQEFTPPSKAALAPFWASRKRYTILRLGFRALCEQCDLNPQWFETAIKERTQRKDMAPGDRTLRRFYAGIGKTTLVDHYHKTGLLLTCHDLYEKRKKDIDESNDAINNLIALAQEFILEFGWSLREARRMPPREMSEGADGVYSREKAQQIHDNIVIPPRDDPDTPEFPPHAPRFPATPMDPYVIEGRNVLIKDESRNPTGTHKDRWAWEMLVRYKEIIRDELELGGDGPIHIPPPSMISSGSAALALQLLFHARDLPSLRVIMDKDRTDDRIIQLLRGYGAKIFQHDLDSEELSAEHVLRITQNEDGRDLTSRDLLAPYRQCFYDWFVFEVLEQCAKHIFVPVGTGDLFANIICIIDRQRMSKVRDPRLRGGAASITSVNVYGATTYDSTTQMDKLYAKFRPTLRDIDQLLNQFRERGSLGERTGIFEVTEQSVVKALKYARANNIQTEPSGIAGLALFLDMSNEIPADEKVVIVNTGWMHIAKAGG